MDSLSMSSCYTSLLGLITTLMVDGKSRVTLVPSFRMSDI